MNTVIPVHAVTCNKRSQFFIKSSGYKTGAGQKNLLQLPIEKNNTVWVGFFVGAKCPITNAL
jgi:hypothetical protein